MIAMRKPKYLPWILAVETTGVLSGLLSRQGMQAYTEMIQKPPVSPPGVLFPLVWTILYALMGIGVARIEASADGNLRSRALNVFVVQLVVNFFWSLIFFNARAYGFALVWLLLLWGLIAAMILMFWPVDRLAALRQIPYLLWVTIAAYLNYGVWRLNG